MWHKWWVKRILGFGGLIRRLVDKAHAEKTA
jgi:hypothetical protein